MKNMNKFVFPTLVFTIVAVLSIVLAACGSDDGEAAPAAEAEPAAATGPADGVYFAQEAEYSERTGWKNVAVFVVENGEVVEVEFNAAHVNGGTDKVTRSRDGEYGMYGDGPAQWPWYEQAQAVEAYFLDAQDPSADAPDSISGATISFDYFFTLAQQALDQGPVGYGPWQDGAYHAEAEQFSSSGWKDVVDITVIGGRIVSANWYAIAEDGGTNKKQRSLDGEYGMYGEGPAQWPWWEQAKAAEQHLMETQDPGAIDADAVSGATIRLGGLASVVNEALANARR